MIAGAPTLFTAALVALVLVTGPFCNRRAAGKLARVTFISGSAQVVRAGQPADLKIGAFLERGDVIKTERGAAVEVILKGQGIIRIGEETEIRIAELIRNKRTRIKLQKGRAGFFLHKIRSRGSELRVTLPTATVSVRGTKFLTRLAPEGNVTALFDGKVELGNERGQKLVLGRKGEVKTRQGSELNSDSIKPLSKESLEAMKKLQELTKLDLEKSLRDALFVPGAPLTPARPGGGNLPVPEPGS